MIHIELSYNSLAECYAHAREMLTLGDLMHKAKVVIDIDEDSPKDSSFIRIPEPRWTGIKISGEKCE